MMTNYCLCKTSREGRVLRPLSLRSKIKHYLKIIVNVSNIASNLFLIAQKLPSIGFERETLRAYQLNIFFKKVIMVTVY